MGSLTATGGGNFNYNITGNTTSDVINVAGNLTLSGTNNLNLNFPGAPFAGSYNLLELQRHRDRHLHLQRQRPARRLDLHVQRQFEHQAYVLTTTFLTATWTGTASTAWDTTSNNWSGPGGTKYATGSPSSSTTPPAAPRWSPSRAASRPTA